MSKKYYAFCMLALLNGCLVTILKGAKIHGTYTIGLTIMEYLVLYNVNTNYHLQLYTEYNTTFTPTIHNIQYSTTLQKNYYYTILQQCQP